MRRPHWLKRNEGTELPHHIICVDTEAKIEQVSPTLQKQTLWFGSAVYLRFRDDGDGEYDNEEWITFTEAIEFWSWVDSKAKGNVKVWVFCHNWNYDAAILWVATLLLSLGWEPWRYINEAPPVVVSFRKNGATIQLTDTLNYFVGSLASIGKSIGIQKLTMPSFTASYEEWLPYNKQDVLVLKEAVLVWRRFISENDLGTFQATLASQALTAYRHRFMHTPIFIHSNLQAIALEREAYHGGRVEAFFLGTVSEPMYLVDINSMYPTMMVRYPMPTSLKDVYTEHAQYYLERHHGTYAQIARVRVRTLEPVYAVVHDHRLVFPVGEFETVLTTPEIAYALTHGHIVEVLAYAKYTQEVIFREYVEFFYDARRRYANDKNDTFAYLSKIMLNALYGKFGQSGIVWQDIGPAESTAPVTWVEQEAPGFPIKEYRVRLGIKQEKKRSSESNNSFPAIAAHVTAYARMDLWRLIQQAGRDHVLYVDTDSLIVDEIGYHNLQEHIHPTRLGALKVVAASQEATFYGAKEYTFGHSSKRKGIRWNAVPIAENVWEQDKFHSWDYLHSQGADGFIIVERVQKHLTHEYRKGTVLPGGKIIPLEVGL